MVLRFDANGGGAVLNILSVLSWRSFGVGNAYAAAKAASWSLTNGARLELAPQGTQVAALHVGGIDTDMLAGFEAEKSDPADIARPGLDGIAASAMEILADRNALELKAILSADPGIVHPELAGTGPAR